MKEILQTKLIKSSITLKLRSRVVIILPLHPPPPSLISFLNVCISYRVGTVGGYEQEPEQEVLTDPQAPSFEETNPGSQQGKTQCISPPS
jgi:hypothetical protein